MKFYTLIGSRETPDHKMDQLEELAIKLERMDYALRSGGANGSDSAAESVTRKQVFLPWNGFNRHYDNNAFGFGYINYQTLGKIEECEALRARHHKWYFSAQKEGVKHLQRRNMHQILGLDLNNASEFVLCYAKQDIERGEGHVQGGTGSAVSLALELGLPVCNLYFDGNYESILRWIEGAK